jgi:hypothetical protein
MKPTRSAAPSPDAHGPLAAAPRLPLCLDPKAGGGRLPSPSIGLDQLNCDLTSGLLNTTNAQMPKGSPSRQHGDTHGSMARMQAAKAYW